MENNHVNNSEIANNGRNISSPLSLGEGSGVRLCGIASPKAARLVVLPPTSPIMHHSLALTLMR